MPPPPPGGSMPPPPPPMQQDQQSWNAPAPGQAYPTTTSGFDPKSVTPMDWVVVAMGPLAFIFSLFSFYTGKATASFEGISRSASAHESAWHGFFGWFGAVIALLASAAVAIELFAPQIKLPVPTRLAALGGFALAFVCYLIAWFVTPGVTNVPDISGVKVSYGRGIGFYAGLIFVLAGLVVSFLRFQQKGGKLPGRA
jgi:hypothetical protein